MMQKYPASQAYRVKQPRGLPNKQRREDRGHGLSSAWVLSPRDLLACAALCHLTAQPNLLFSEPISWQTLSKCPLNSLELREKQTQGKTGAKSPALSWHASEFKAHSCPWASGVSPAPSVSPSNPPLSGPIQCSRNKEPRGGNCLGSARERVHLIVLSASHPCNRPLLGCLLHIHPIV